MKKYFFIAFLLFSLFTRSQTGWLPVSNFGTNPGNLNMYAYVPAGITAASPLVVVLHGCTQNAATFSNETGWNKLADQYKFYVVYPEQNSSNNSSNCFNWFQSGDQDRNQGEAFSVKQMVDYMKSNYTIDANRVFVTGLSAGACMTAVMLACYPDVFNKGAVMAGCPYKSATNSSQALNVMYGFVTNTPQNWGALVTGAYPGYTGHYPEVGIYHGSYDNVVSPVNQTELMKQWTNVHFTDQTADVSTTPFNGNAFVSKNIYADPNGATTVETFTLSGMAHGIALDTGNCYQQCGKTGNYAFEFYMSSTFFAANFFGIVTPPYSITGAISVNASQNGVSYSVPSNAGSTYTWTVPPGATIASGQGTNSINVNFGSSSGYVEVTETESNGCKNGPVKLFVTVGANGISSFNSDDFSCVQMENGFLLRSENRQAVDLSVCNVMGEEVLKCEAFTNEKIGFTSPAGLYVLTIRTKNRTLARKIVLH